ncbi:hypothetical protein HHK36_004928 [Tetracentron sinense]|uniref:GST C-terminal domain-containing protein n=1 Tax=Tetracentron sinense TaxID=13715 RepID=A0A835DQA7_TETSI|nr:hypothetical protein HHK36_004928 [Tetracentron sinense]
MDNYLKQMLDCGRRIWASKGEDQEAAKKEFIECLKVLEGELGEKPYFGGECFGFLDIALILFSCRIYTYEKLSNFSTDEECPKLMEWVKRCKERESVPKALPDALKFYEIAMVVKKRFDLRSNSRIVN